MTTSWGRRFSNSANVMHRRLNSPRLGKSHQTRYVRTMGVRSNLLHLNANATNFPNGWLAKRRRPTL